MTEGAKRSGRPARERDRYRRAPLVEQAGDALRGLGRNTALLALVIALVGGWAVLQITAPRNVRLADLTVGTCLHVPTSADGNLVSMGQVGPAGEVESTTAAGGAQLAPCDASHSHEVAGVFSDTDPAGTPYPGSGTLAQRHRAACESAFASYVGHALAGSSLGLTVVVPSSDGWSSGQRAGACLVSNADLTFLSSRAGGSRR